MRVLNDSIILRERIKEDYGTKRFLNFDSVLNKHNEKSFQKKVSGNFSQDLNGTLRLLVSKYHGLLN